MKPVVAQLLVTLGITAVLTLATFMLEEAELMPRWQHLAFAGLCFVVIGVSLELFFYRRLRRLHRRVRQNLSRKDGLDMGISPPSGDLVEALYQSIVEVHIKLRKEFAEMREVETFRREFLGDVSHELKTPIFSIQGYVETLLDGALEDTNVNRKFLKKALNNVFRLDNLARDLLTISQLETGSLRMEISEFKIYDVVLDVFESETYKLEKAHKQVTLKLNANNLETLYVQADRERIRQVLENLVNNAIKYGRDKDATVEVHFQLQGQNGRRHLNVSVEDNGPGIAPEHHARIFERFYRVEKSRSRERGGTGLGLSIVRHLVAAHDQTIGVQSVVGKGTTFTFTLKPVLPK